MNIKANLSDDVDRKLLELAEKRNIPKHELVKLALEEFVENYKDEVAA